MKQAFGGVLINDQGQILLRRVTNDFGGYRWTYPKGRPDPGETPEQTALRETLEETGYQAEIIGQLPGSFGGEVTSTVMFLMRPIGEPGPFGWETAEVRWVDPADAPALLSLTTHNTGRERDLGILAAAVKLAGLAAT